MKAFLLKIWRYCLDTKLGHFLSLLVMSTLAIWGINSLIPDRIPFTLPTFVMVSVIALLFALTDRNYKWY